MSFEVRESGVLVAAAVAGRPLEGICQEAAKMQECQCEQVPAKYEVLASIKMFTK